ncbi:permease [Bacillus thuringiensis]|uniref:permease n=2 Tax=Bacillus thuringiensis TaxID=1428 RepID=UPI001F0A0B5E|nr:permease [Bacillus thuringiensis]
MRIEEMTISNKFWTRLFTILVALNLATAIVSAFLQKWWLVSAGLGGACLMAGIGLVILNGKATKWAAIFFTVAALENGLEVSRLFWMNQYSDSVWSIARIVLCVYWMRKYYMEEE